MGRAPIGHPPGSEVSARPSRASSGAQKRMEARIWAAVSPEGCCLTGVPATTMSAPCRRAHTLPRSSARLHSTSDSARHGPQPHRSPAEQRRRKERKYAVFRRRYRRRRRSAAVRPSPKSARSPVSYPLPPFRKRYPTVCKSGEICLSFGKKLPLLGRLAQSHFLFLFVENMLYLSASSAHYQMGGR